MKKMLRKKPKIYFYNVFINTFKFLLLTEKIMNINTYFFSDNVNEHNVVHLIKLKKSFIYEKEKKFD